MASTDNKILNGAGVEKLSQLVKDAIAQGGGTEYTAGDGININANNVIKAKLGKQFKAINGTLQSAPIIPIAAGGSSHSWTGIGSMSYESDANEFINKLYENLPLFGKPKFSPYALMTAKDANNTTRVTTIYKITADGSYIVCERALDAINNFPNWNDSTNWYFEAVSDVANDGKLKIFCAVSTEALQLFHSKQLVYSNANLTATNIPAAIDELNLKIGSGSSGGASLPDDPQANGSYKLVNTVATPGDAGTLSWEVNTAVPTKTSDLTNDSGFITSIPIATANAVGVVKPDGTTITIDSNGTISAQGGGGSSLPVDPVVDGSYKLVNTVTTVEGTQTATQSWQEDSGSGGASYTFTNGLTESDGTVSWDLNNRIALGTHSSSPGLRIHQIPSYPAACGGSNSINMGFTINKQGAQGNNCILIGQDNQAQSNVWNAYVIGSTNEINGKSSYSQVFGRDNTVVFNGSTSTDGGVVVGHGLNVYSQEQNAFGAYNVTDRNRVFRLIIGNGSSSNRNNLLANNGTDTFMSGDVYIKCTDFTTTSSGPTTANCGGQKVFYGNLSSTDTAPTTEGAINWVYA